MDLSKLGETVENRGASCPTVHGVSKSPTRLSDWKTTTTKHVLSSLLGYSLQLPCKGVRWVLIIPDLQMRTFKTQTFSLLFKVTQKDSHPVFWPQRDAWVGASVLVCTYVWLYLFTHMCMCDCMCVCTYAIHMCEWQSQDSSPDLSDVKDAFSYHIFKIKKKRIVTDISVWL